MAATLLVAACAEHPQRSASFSFANRCFNAAIIATEIQPVMDQSLDVCANALASSSLSQRDRAATLANRGILYLGRAEYDQALKDFNQAINMAPDVGETYVNRGAAFLALHRYPEALEDLNRAIALNSRQPEKAFYNRAIAREQLNDIKGAYYDYLKAAELRPDWDLPKQDLQRFKVIRRSTNLA